MVNHSSFIIHHSSFTAHLSPFIINHSSFTSHRSSFIIHHSSFLKLFQQERGTGAEIDAEGEVELLAAAAGGALSQPALAGFYASAQYIVAGKGVVVVGTKVGCAYAVETFAAFPDT